MPQENNLDIQGINQRFYDRLWSRSRLISPDRFNTWDIVQSICKSAPARLEVAPGLRPRLPFIDTEFVDISTPALMALRQAGGRASRATLSALPFADATFDLVATFDVLEHVEDDTTALEEVARVLKPGGKLLLSIPLYQANWTPFDKIVGHWRRYEPTQLKELFSECGLRIERSAIFGMKPQTSWLVNLGMWFLENRPVRAMWWYNNVFMPLGLRRQPALQFREGLIEDRAVDEVIVVATRL
ncbi:MAG: class I SAM-dependent methyltransferase [Oceanococcus sp.]